MIVPATVTDPARLVRVHLGTATECIRASDPGAALRWLEQAALELGNLLDALQAMPEHGKPGEVGELLLLIGKLRGRVPHAEGHETEGVSDTAVSVLAPAATLRRCDELLDAAGITGP